MYEIVPARWYGNIVLIGLDAAPLGVLTTVCMIVLTKVTIGGSSPSQPPSAQGRQPGSEKARAGPYKKNVFCLFFNAIYIH